MKYVIKPEMLGGKEYWMIYYKWLWFEWFFERWNSLESAINRMEELGAVKYKTVIIIKEGK